MERKENNFTLIEQARIAPEVAGGVLSSVILQAENGFGIPDDVIRSLNRVIITGCGDSWMSSNAILPLFNQVAGINAVAEKCISFTRFYDSFTDGDMLVIGVTISGGVVRTKEAIMRANERGIHTMAVTNNPASETAQISDYCAEIGLPRGLVHGYGLHSYTCSVITLACVGAHFARVRGRIDDAEYNRILASLESYITSYDGVFDSYDRQSRELVGSWKNLRAFDFIGDGNDFSTAYFSCANVVEEFGAPAFARDSIDWLYSNANCTNPEGIGRLIVVNEKSATKQQLTRCAQRAVEMNSPCCVITDSDSLELPDGCVVFRTPKAGYQWMNAAMQHIPFSVLVGYIRRQLGRVSFCADVEAYHNAKIYDGQDRLKGSRLVII